LHFRELTQLRLIGRVDAYISEFQRLAVMVKDVSEDRLIILFIEGLSEPLCGWIKAFKPTSLQDAIIRARDMEYSIPKNKFLSKPFLPQKNKDKKPF
jgi:hypothetical protein